MAVAAEKGGGAGRGVAVRAPHLARLSGRASAEACAVLAAAAFRGRALTDELALIITREGKAPPGVRGESSAVSSSSCQAASHCAAALVRGCGGPGCAERLLLAAAAAGDVAVGAALVVGHGAHGTGPVPGDGRVARDLGCVHMMMGSRRFPRGVCGGRRVLLFLAGVVEKKNTSKPWHSLFVAQSVPAGTSPCRTAVLPRGSVGWARSWGGIGSSTRTGPPRGGTPSFRRPPCRRRCWALWGRRRLEHRRRPAQRLPRRRRFCRRSRHRCTDQRRAWYASQWTWKEAARSASRPCGAASSSGARWPAAESPVGPSLGPPCVSLAGTRPVRRRTTVAGTDTGGRAGELRWASSPGSRVTGSGWSPPTETRRAARRASTRGCW
jgi:hypothetical protein